MKLPDLTIISEYMKIPQVFYSSETNQPFAHCISCDKYLLRQGVQYVIEKAIKNYKKFNTTDTIFEYAMCMACYEEVHKSFSDLSKQRIDAYFSQNVDLAQRRRRLLEQGQPRIDEWLANCVVKGTPAHELSEYQIVCQCDGHDMLFTYSPFLIGNEAMDEVVQLLSNQTLGEIDGLYGDLFGLSPELQGLLNDPKYLLV